MAERLSEEKIAEEISRLDGWTHLDDTITKNYKLDDFAEALELTNRIGEAAEEMDHHPDILLHNWNQVRVTLTTHSAKGITNNDIELAKRIDRFQT